MVVGGLATRQFARLPPVTCLRSLRLELLDELGHNSQIRLGEVLGGKIASSYEARHCEVSVDG